MAVPRPPVAPMLARGQAQIPRGGDWVYEPKWDGFRAIVFRDGDDLHMGSRNGQALERYFPELRAPLLAGLAPTCVVDGEIIIAGSGGLDFSALQSRIHPAASRVKLLSAEIPATFIVFDLIGSGQDDLRSLPLRERRALCETHVRANNQVAITPQTADAGLATSWFTLYEGAGLDGVVAKAAGGPYRSGDRGWVKIKHLRTVDCVVGGYRRAVAEAAIGSLLLGLYDQEGVLHHVGHTSSFSAAERREILRQLHPLEGGESFAGGRTPGGPSRWTRGRDAEWVPVTPSLVCEVAFDHLQGDRFRHASRFLRWRPDKPPAECTYDQLTPPETFSLSDVVDLGPG
ncbi:MAG: ATP-dependent DNA ligase [Candidatus Dormibacteria bacterium]